MRPIPLTNNDQPDPLRPRVHFMPERYWMNDPNGLIFWRGRHHLFYQHNPFEATHGHLSWGHASSEDLLRWEHHRLALEPDEPYDRGGCYSGCSVVERSDDGPLTLLYTGVVRDAGGRELRQTQCRAVSDDGLTFIKAPANPILRDPPRGYDVTCFRDPFVWCEEDDAHEPWRMTLTGAADRGPGGSGLGEVLLYRSGDLRRWLYQESILQAIPQQAWTAHECPNLVRLGGKRVLITSPQPSWRTYFWVDENGGSFDAAAGQRLDLGDCFYAALTYRHAGRTLMFGWLRETRDWELTRDAGWSGVMSLPRELGIDPSGRVTQRPAAEVLKLRAEPLNPQHLPMDKPVELEVVAGPSLTLTPRSGGGSDEVWSLPAWPHTREVCTYRLFVDASTIEMFADDGRAAAYRCYDTTATLDPTEMVIKAAWRLGVPAAMGTRGRERSPSA